MMYDTQYEELMIKVDRLISEIDPGYVDFQIDAAEDARPRYEQWGIATKPIKAAQKRRPRTGRIISVMMSCLILATAITMAFPYAVAPADGEREIFDSIPTGTPFSAMESGCAADNDISAAQNAGSDHALDVSETLEFVDIKEADQNDMALTVKNDMASVVADPGLLFDFTLYLNGVVSETFKLRAGDTAIFTVPNGAAYEVRETVRPGYSLLSITNGAGTVIGSDIEVIATNQFTGAQKEEGTQW